MIEPKVPGVRTGMGYIKIGPSETFTQGAFVKLSSSTWGSEAPGTPGKAYNGALCYVPATDSDDINTPVYPIKKLIYKPENSETDLDTVSSGDGIIIFMGGQYETDAYDTDVEWDSVDPGTLLYLNSDSVLTTGQASDTTPARARFLKVASSYNSKYASREVIWYELINQEIAVTSGNLGF